LNLSGWRRLKEWTEHLLVGADVAVLLLTGPVASDGLPPSTATPGSDLPRPATLPIALDLSSYLDQNWAGGARRSRTADALPHRAGTTMMSGSAMSTAAGAIAVSTTASSSSFDTADCHPGFSARPASSGGRHLDFHALPHNLGEAGELTHKE
jgi:hypothetical protein